MAVTNTMIVVAIALAINYFLLYRKSKFFGNVVVIAIGILIIMLETQATAFGIIISACGFVSMLFDLLT